MVIFHGIASSLNEVSHQHVPASSYPTNKTDHRLYPTYLSLPTHTHTHIEQVFGEGGSWSTGWSPSATLLCLLGGDVASGHATVFKIRAVMKSPLRCRVNCCPLKAASSICLAVIQSVVVIKYNKFPTSYRPTSVIWGVRFQTDAIKRVVIFLLVKGLV